MKKLLHLLKANGIELDKIERANTRLLHGKLGAYIVGEKYGFDKQIQDAIKYHTATFYGMDKLAKIIYVADKIEKTRKPSERMDQWRRVANEDLDQAIILIIDYVIGKIIEENGLIHPTIIETRNRIMLDLIQGKKQTPNQGEGKEDID